MAALAALRSRRGLARASAAFSTWTPSAWTSAAQASASTARRPSARASARPRICGALHGDRSLRRSFYRIVSSEKGGKDRHLTIPFSRKSSVLGRRSFSGSWSWTSRARASARAGSRLSPRPSRTTCRAPSTCSSARAAGRRSAWNCGSHACDGSRRGSVRLWCAALICDAVGWQVGLRKKSLGRWRYGNGLGLMGLLGVVKAMGNGRRERAKQGNPERGLLRIGAPVHCGAGRDNSDRSYAQAARRRSRLDSPNGSTAASWLAFSFSTLAVRIRPLL